jgi:competence protein ComEA
MNPMRTVLSVAAALVMAGNAWAEPVNVNTADPMSIAEALKGVGASKAEAIVAYREQHGAFRSVDELLDVKGIGEKTIADNREDILLK